MQMQKRTKMNEHKTIQEWLDYRHPDIWKTLSPKTKELLEKDHPVDVFDEAVDYADSHNASNQHKAGLAFYLEASESERKAARTCLKDEYKFQELNPLNLMCNHNFHIIMNRYNKTVKQDLKNLYSTLKEDTQSEKSDLKKEVDLIRKAANETEDQNIKKILEDSASNLEKKAQKWLKHIVKYRKNLNI